MPIEERAVIEAEVDVSVRRQPQTARAHKTFDALLTNALEILANEGIDQLTTRRVAARAGVNIASLYAYFPNKQAILLAAFERWSTKVMAALDRAAEQSLGKVELLPFLDRVLAELHVFDMDLRIWLALHQGMKTYTSLHAAERDHAERVATRLAGYLRAYGSTWSDDALRSFGLMAYEFDCLMVSRLATTPPEQTALTFELGRMTAQRMFEMPLGPEPAAKNAAD